MNYTVTLTDTEKAAMEYVAYDPQDWVENSMKERARIAIDEIVKLAVEKFLAANQTIPGSKEEIVAAAYSNGWIQTLKYRTDNASNEPI
jgi:glycine cleavage system H lipoate-binding protein